MREREVRLVEEFRHRAFWRWLALSGVVLAAVFLFAALIFSWWGRGPFAASPQAGVHRSTPTEGETQPFVVTPAERSSARIQAISSAVRVAAGLALTLERGGLHSAQAAPRVLTTLLQTAGITLPSAIKLADDIWSVYGKKKPPPLPPVLQTANTSTGDIHVTVVIRRRSGPDRDDCRRSSRAAQPGRCRR